MMTFGARFPDDVKPECVGIDWGARAIWRSYEPHFDLLPDRQQMSSYEDNEVVRKKLSTWINKVGLKELGKLAKRIGGDSSEVLRFDQGEFGICGTPNASHGYMYIRAWMKKPKETQSGQADTERPAEGRTVAQ